MAFYFTEDIMIDILLRLPAKDLSGFKIVSKLWYSLISDSNFRKAHFQRSSAQQDIILTILKSKNSETMQKEIRDNRGSNLHKNNDILDEKFLSINMQDKNMIRVEDFYLDFPIHWKLTILATCNGLLLVLDEYGILYVYNAVTHQYWVVPFPANYYRNDGRRCTSWDLGSHDWTLFYDDSVGKYKACGIGSDKCILITVGENDWNELPLSRRHHGHKLSPPIYLDRELHWLIYERYDGDYWEYFVLSMDVATKLFRKTKAQILQCKGNSHHCILSEVKGSLCLTSAYSDKIDIFVLEDRSVDSNWIQYYSISLQDLGNIPTSLTSFVSDDVCLVAMRDIEGYDYSDLVKVFVRHENKLIYYDLKRKESKEIVTLSEKERLRDFYHYYSGSFVSW